MRILFANEYFVPYAPGGAEWSMYFWTRQLAKKGHEVVIVTPDLSSGDGKVKHETDEQLLMAGKVTINRFPFRKIMSAAPKVFPSYVYGNPIFRKYYTGKIIEAAASLKAEIIVANGYDSICPAYEGGSILKIPAIATIRDYRPLCPVSICLHKDEHAPVKCNFGDFRKCVARYNTDYGYNPGLIKALKMWSRRFLEWQNSVNVRNVLPAFGGAVFVSRKIRQIYSKSELLPEKNEVVYNLLPEFSEKSDPDNAVKTYGLKGKRVLLFVGRFSIGKGARIISEAMKLITKQVPNAVLVVAGNREYESRNEKIIFAGHLNSKKLSELYAVSDAVVLPSRWPEPLSRVHLEAASFNVPVIATKAGGNPEVVTDGENGFLAERNDVKSFADGCIRMLNIAREDYKKMQTKIEANIKAKFDNEILTKKLEEFYIEVARGGAK